MQTQKRTLLGAGVGLDHFLSEIFLGHGSLCSFILTRLTKPTGNFFFFLNSYIVLSFVDTDFFFKHVTEFKKKSDKGTGFGNYGSVYILMFRT